jgi:cell division protein FtsZ
VGKGTSFRDALKKADEVLLHATQGISDLIHVTGEVNVDFADVRTIMQSRGPALMGTGFGRGEHRAVEAAQEAISSPLLDSVTIEGAAGVLINITGGMDLTIDEVTTIASIIQEAAGDDAEIIFGAVHDPTLEGEVRVTVIATGLEQEVALSPVIAARPVAAVGGGLGYGTRTVMPAAAALPAEPAFARASHGPVAVARPQPQVATPEPQPFQRMPQAPVSRHQLTDLDIPTFIRRQMD